MILFVIHYFIEKDLKKKWNWIVELDFKIWHQEFGTNCLGLVIWFLGWLFFTFSCWQKNDKFVNDSPKINNNQDYNLKKKASSDILILRPGGSTVHTLASDMPKSPKGRKPLKAKYLSLLLSNLTEILKRGMTKTEQKPKGTTF